MPWCLCLHTQDVGTDNVKLRSDPLYMGLQQPRIQGAEYYELLDEVWAPLGCCCCCRDCC